MSLPNAKELKKLAKAMRDAGIQYFKSADIEISLSGVAPEKRSTSKRAPALLPDVQGEIETDIISESELLFWSSGGDINTQSHAQTQE